MKKILSNQTGFSLVQVMVGFAMAGGLSVTMMKIMSNANNSAIMIESKGKLNDFYRDRIGLLRRSDICAKSSLMGFDVGQAGGIIPAFDIDQNNVIDAADIHIDFPGGAGTALEFWPEGLGNGIPKVLATIGSQIQAAPKWNLNKVYIQKFVPSDGVAGTSLNGSCNLLLEIEKKAGRSDQRTGVSKYYKLFPMSCSIESAASQVITACAVGSGSDTVYWKKIEPAIIAPDLVPRPNHLNFNSFTDLGLDPVVTIGNAQIVATEMSVYYPLEIIDSFTNNFTGVPDLTNSIDGRNFLPVAGQDVNRVYQNGIKLPANHVIAWAESGTAGEYNGTIGIDGDATCFNVSFSGGEIPITLPAVVANNFELFEACSTGMIVNTTLQLRDTLSVENGIVSDDGETEINNSLTVTANSVTGVLTSGKINLTANALLTAPVVGTGQINLSAAANISSAGTGQINLTTTGTTSQINLITETLTMTTFGSGEIISTAIGNITTSSDANISTTAQGAIAFTSTAGTSIDASNLAITADTNITGNLSVSGYIDMTSDENLKKNITKITNAVSKIQELNGVEYFWRYDELVKRQMSHEKQYGLIAQDVQKVFPELVHRRADGYLAVSYIGLFGVVIEGIKEQAAEINILKVKLAKQEKRLNRLESKLSELIEATAKEE